MGRAGGPARRVAGVLEQDQGPRRHARAQTVAEPRWRDRARSRRVRCRRAGHLTSSKRGHPLIGHAAATRAARFVRGRVPRRARGCAQPDLRALVARATPPLPGIPRGAARAFRPTRTGGRAACLRRPLARASTLRPACAPSVVYRARKASAISRGRGTPGSYVRAVRGGGSRCGAAADSLGRGALSSPTRASEAVVTNDRAVQKDRGTPATRRASVAVAPFADLAGRRHARWSRRRTRARRHYAPREAAQLVRDCTGLDVRAA